MTDKLRFGIVGCGVIGPIHAQAITSLPDAQLVAVTDINPKCAQQLANTYGAKSYTSLTEMLAREQLDVVNVCTPSGLHGEQACQVMRSGRHVIVEKPMAISHETIEEMLRVQQETGKKFAVISQHRFDPASQKVHDLVEQHALGKLVLGNAVVPWWRSQAYYDSGAWRGTWQLDGGGVLMNQSIHSIDLLQWFMGKVSSIYAYTSTLAHRMQTEDVAVAVLRFANGAFGTIAATTAAYPGVTTRIEICGDKGSAVIEDDALSFLRIAGAEGNEIDIQPDKQSRKQENTAAAGATSNNPAELSYQNHALQIADMIRAIRENGTPLIDGQAARHPVEIILGIYASARTHQEITLP
jgi:UDP-N-acetyl-2-amino-2-deoxyglucuronate dehydrogenase